MTKFGGSTFLNCSVPLAFKGRYFILEPGNPPSFSVVLEYNGKPIFEIKKNVPLDNSITDVSISAAGIVTVSDKATGKFLGGRYRVGIGSDHAILLIYKGSDSHK